jgi:hypothetical protein
MTSSPTWATTGTPVPASPELDPEFIGPPTPPIDPATADLLAPAGTSPATTPADDYPEQPADREPFGTPTPADPAAERAAWDQLAAFIQAHKDPGTTVVMVDADTFSNNI